MEHLLSSLLEDAGGLATSILNKAEVNTESLKQRVEQVLERLPKVSGSAGAADQVYLTGRLNRLFALAEEEAKKQGIKIGIGKFPWAASGRAIANGRDEGFTKLIFDHATHRLLGGGIVGTHAGDLISELALAVEMGADAVDIGKTIHPHLTLGESMGMAAEVYEGVCTDLMPVKK